MRHVANGVLLFLFVATIVAEEFHRLSTEKGGEEQFLHEFVDLFLAADAEDLLTPHQEVRVTDPAINDL